jgi:hypothetical protein
MFRHVGAEGEARDRARDARREALKPDRERRGNAARDKRVMQQRAPPPRRNFDVPMAAPGDCYSGANCTRQNCPFKHPRE